MASSPSDGSGDPAAQLYPTLESHHRGEIHYLQAFHFNYPKLHLQPGRASQQRSNITLKTTRPREDPVAPGLGPQSCVDPERKGSQPFGFHYPPPYPQEKSEDFPVTSDPSYQQV